MKGYKKSQIDSDKVLDSSCDLTSILIISALKVKLLQSF